MPCGYPIPAWKTPDGAIRLWKVPVHEETLLLPCGKCAGCRKAQAKAWALRCQLESNQHASTAFTTLTYDDKRLPPTLSRRDLQLFLKRFRKEMGADRPIRFFASGEYGETTQRPHYHAIIYGASDWDAQAIEKTWGKGHTKTVNCTAAAIAYVAGYTAKKLEDNLLRKQWGEMVDPATGEVYMWQPPFLQMSRRPGIGGDARKYKDSWRTYAICNGTKQAVPRFLHEAWKATATEQEIEQLAEEKKQIVQMQNLTLEMIEANEKIELARQALNADKRKL